MPRDLHTIARRVDFLEEQMEEIVAQKFALMKQLTVNNEEFMTCTQIRTLLANPTLKESDLMLWGIRPADLRAHLDKLHEMYKTWMIQNRVPKYDDEHERIKAETLEAIRNLEIELDTIVQQVAWNKAIAIHFYDKRKAQRMTSDMYVHRLGNAITHLKTKLEEAKTNERNLQQNLSREINLLFQKMHE